MLGRIHRRTIRGIGRMGALAALGLLVGMPAIAKSADFTVTGHYSFPNAPGNPLNPVGAPVTDAKGNVYGVTGDGGSETCMCGTVFELSPPADPKSKTWTRKTLYTFSGTSFTGNSAFPKYGLYIDAHDNLFGTTNYGGKYGYGVVFELSGPERRYESLYDFPSGGAAGPLIGDKNGNLYGAASGQVYALAPPAAGKIGWKWKQLYLFDGQAPQGSLSFLNPANPAAGIYGVASLESDVSGADLIYHLVAPASGAGLWTERTDATLKSTDGPLNLKSVYPVRSHGELFLIGASLGGGRPPCACGTLFAVDTSTHKVEMLHEFAGAPADGSMPSIAAPIALPSGDYLIQGTTASGGSADLGTIWAGFIKWKAAGASHKPSGPLEAMFVLAMKTMCEGQAENCETPTPPEQNPSPPPCQATGTTEKCDSNTISPGNTDTAEPSSGAFIGANYEVLVP